MTVEHHLPSPEGRSEGLRRNTMNTSLKVTRVSKSFRSIQAVSDISFEVNTGEIFGLLGPNGAGKTTTVRMIMDILRPDSGSIEIFGHTLRHEDKARLGYLPEERGLYTKQRVLATLEYLASLKGVRGNEGKCRAQYWLNRFGIEDRSTCRIEELSKGNQQKVQLIATLINDPDLLVLDEPFSGLDPINSKMLTGLLRELASRGKTIVLSSHQMPVIETLCQRVAMIFRGRIALYGELNDIRKHYSRSQVRIQTSTNLHSCELVTTLIPDENGVKVLLQEGITPMQLLSWIIVRGGNITLFEESLAPLEDVYVEIVGRQ